MKQIRGRNGGTLKTLEPGDKLQGSGHPGGMNFKTIARKYLDSQQRKQNPITGTPDNISGMEEVFLSLMNVILNSDNDSAKIAAIRELLDRIEGKPVQQLDHTVSERQERVRALFPTAEELQAACPDGDYSKYNDK